jgi:hypothetical protein
MVNDCAHMPPTISEYETFDYAHFDDLGLSLDEAVKKAAQLRSFDPKHFHRIMPVDSNMSSFRVESVPVDVAYSEAMSRWSALLNKFRTSRR